MFPFTLLAQVAAPLVSNLPAVTLVPILDPNQEFLQLLLQSMNGVKGAGALAIAAIVIKLLLKALDLPVVETWLGQKFSDWGGGLKMTITLLFSYVGGVLALMVPPTSLSFGAALVHSTALASFIVLSNQLYKHYIEKKPTPAPDQKPPTT